jgi:hypothetical protein
MEVLGLSQRVQSWRVKLVLIPVQGRKQKDKVRNF